MASTQKYKWLNIYRICILSSYKSRLSMDLIVSTNMWESSIIVNFQSIALRFIDKDNSH